MVYACLMGLLSFPFLFIGRQVFRGRIQWIHDYHRRRVTDTAGYGRGMGQAILGIGVTMLFSGGLALCSEAALMNGTAAVVLLAGLVLCFIRLYRVQKRYNGGMF